MKKLGFLEIVYFVFSAIVMWVCLGLVLENKYFLRSLDYESESFLALFNVFGAVLSDFVAVLAELWILHILVSLVIVIINVLKKKRSLVLDIVFGLWNTLITVLFLIVGISSFGRNSWGTLALALLYLIFTVCWYIYRCSPKNRRKESNV